MQIAPHAKRKPNADTQGYIQQYGAGVGGHLEGPIHRQEGESAELLISGSVFLQQRPHYGFGLRSSIICLFSCGLTSGRVLGYAIYLAV